MNINTLKENTNSIPENFSYSGNKKNEGILKKINDYATITIFFCILSGSIFQIYWNIISPYWGDEAFTGALACQKNISSTLSYSEGDVHPPLYYLIAHTIFSVTGCNLLYARMCGVIVLLLSFIYYYKKNNRNIKIFLFFFVCSPVFWHYAFEARSYSLVLASSIMAVANWRSRRERNWYYGLFFCFFAAFLHYISAIMPFVYFIYSFFVKKNTDKTKLYVFFFALCALCIYYAYSVFRCPPILSNGFWIQPPKIHDIYNIIYFFFDNKLTALIAGGGLFFGAWVSKTQKKSLKQILFGPLATLAVVIILYSASYIKPMFIYRYIYFIFPVLVFSCEKSFSLLMFEKHKKTIALNFAIALSSFVFLLSSVNVYNDREIEWYSAAKHSKCNALQCGFIFNDSVLPAYTDKQYSAIASVFFKKHNKDDPTIDWIAVRPANFLQWLALNPNKYFIYVRPGSEIYGLIKNHKVICTKIEDSESLECYSL